jgi:predicted phage terminase large subunit-like protein
MKFTEAEYQTLLRSDLSAFIERSFAELNPRTLFLTNWHIQVIADALEKCRRGEINRLIINQPPRSLKSHSVSIAFVAWLLGHSPWEQIICASYAQELAEKHAMDNRTLMMSDFYRKLFPTRLSPQKLAVADFLTTQRGYRLSSSKGGALTGRGANFIIIDDLLKPDEALSDNLRQAANDWFVHTLYSRLNDKRTGCIIVIMQRLHEDDLVGYIQRLEPWHVLSFPAIAEQDERYEIETPFGLCTVGRAAGEALHHEREPLELLAQLRARLGEYHFAGQYQQSPAPLGGGLVKAEWFKAYTESEKPATFDLIFQSWDTANKATELSDHSVCTTWGIKGKNLYLINVLRKRLEYPELRRAVKEQASAFAARTILIEDKASGTQLIQDLIADGVHGVTRYQPKLEKIVRMHSVTSTMENGFVYLPESAHWRAEYLHELVTFPKGRFDDQADSTSQALDWFKMHGSPSWYEQMWKREAERIKEESAKPAAYNFKNLPEGWLEGFSGIRRFR